MEKNVKDSKFYTKSQFIFDANRFGGIWHAHRDMGIFHDVGIGKALDNHDFPLHWINRKLVPCLRNINDVINARNIAAVMQKRPHNYY